MVHILLFIVFLFCLGQEGQGQQPPPPFPGSPLPPVGSIPLPYFTSPNPWNQDVTTAPVHPSSSSFTSWLGSNGGFGGSGGIIQMDLFGFNVLYVNCSTGLWVPFIQKPGYYSDCDPLTTLPVPSRGALEAGNSWGQSATCAGDCHLLVVDVSTKLLWESWDTAIVVDPISGEVTSVSSTCAVVWNLTASYTKGRGLGCTSADAAGFPISPLLFTPEEVKVGSVNHAIRFILPNARMRSQMYVPPGTHFGGPTSTSPSAPPYGSRWRLKPTFNIASLTPAAQVLARALQKYGMLLSDGGSMALTGINDAFSAVKWTDVALAPRDLSTLTPSDFEVLEWNSGLNPWDGPAQTNINCVKSPEVVPPRIPSRCIPFGNGSNETCSLRAPGFDKSRCPDNSTMAQCFPTCALGYRPASAGPGPVIVGCANGTFKVGIPCVPTTDTCSLPFLGYNKTSCPDHSQVSQCFPRCFPGFRPASGGSGPTVVGCSSANGTFIMGIPCVPAFENCTFPSLGYNETCRNDSTTRQCFLRCAEGYRPTNGTGPFIMGCDNGTYIMGIPCVPLNSTQCFLPPPRIPYSVDMASTPSGPLCPLPAKVNQTCPIICEAGYIPNGTYICLGSDRWKVPTCVRPPLNSTHCFAPPPKVPHSIEFASTFSGPLCPLPAAANKTCPLVCESGYSPNGTYVCLGFDRWRIPVCLKERNIPVLNPCNDDSSGDFNGTTSVGANSSVGNLSCACSSRCVIQGDDPRVPIPVGTLNVSTPVTVFMAYIVVEVFVLKWTSSVTIVMVSFTQLVFGTLAGGPGLATFDSPAVFSGPSSAGVVVPRGCRARFNSHCTFSGPRVSVSEGNLEQAPRTNLTIAGPSVLDLNSSNVTLGQGALLVVKSITISILPMTWHNVIISGPSGAQVILANVRVILIRIRIKIVMRILGASQTLFSHRAAPAQLSPLPSSNLTSACGLVSSSDVIVEQSGALIIDTSCSTTTDSGQLVSFAAQSLSLSPGATLFLSSVSLGSPVVSLSGPLVWPSTGSVVALVSATQQLTNFPLMTFTPVTTCAATPLGSFSAVDSVTGFFVPASISVVPVAAGGSSYCALTITTGLAATSSAITTTSSITTSTTSATTTTSTTSATTTTTSSPASMVTTTATTTSDSSNSALYGLFALLAIPVLVGAGLLWWFCIKKKPTAEPSPALKKGGRCLQ